MVFTCCNFSDNSAVEKNFGQFFLREKCANDCRLIIYKKQYRDAATATPLHYLKKTNHTFIIFPLTITWVSAPSRRSMCVTLLLTSTFRTLSLWRIWNE